MFDFSRQLARECNQIGWCLCWSARKLWGNSIHISGMPSSVITIVSWDLSSLARDIVVSITLERYLLYSSSLVAEVDQWSIISWMTIKRREKHVYRPHRGLICLESTCSSCKTLARAFTRLSELERWKWRRWKEAEGYHWMWMSQRSDEAEGRVAVPWIKQYNPLKQKSEHRALGQQVKIEKICLLPMTKEFVGCWVNIYFEESRFDQICKLGVPISFRYWTRVVQA